jgi:hypothetical protein
MLPLIGEWREVLFPGFQPVLLAFLAIVLALRAKTPHRQTIAFYVVVALLAFWLSMGPDAGLYTLLYWTVPAFSFLRAPVRFGVLVTLCVAVMSGLAITWLQTRQWSGRRTLALTLLTVAWVESDVGHLRLADLPAVSDAYRRLAVMPRAPVAEFPFFRGIADRHRQTEYMLMSTFHWQPLVNGYSDFIPDGYVEDARVLAGFPSPESWEVLHRREVRWIVVHFGGYPDGGRDLRAQLRKMTTRARLVIDDAGSTLYEVIWPTPTASTRSDPQRFEDDGVVRR